MTPAMFFGRGTQPLCTTIAITARLRQIRSITSKSDVVLAHDREVAARDVAQGDAGVDSRSPRRSPVLTRTTPKMRPFRVTMTCRIRPACSGRLRNSSKLGLRRQDQHVGIHDLRRAPHEKHVGVQSLRNQVAAPEQLQRVDALGRQQAAHAEAERHGEDHRQHDVVVARHLEDHRDGGHRRAGAAADHRPHADHRESRHIDGERHVKRRSEPTRRRRRSSRP